MRLMSPSAQALASFIGISPLALAYMIGIVLRHLLVALITGGGATAHVPLSYPANFPRRYEGEVDNRLSRSGCQARKSAYNSLSPSRLLRDGEQF
jgi:hypothetical protein